MIFWPNWPRLRQALIAGLKSLQKPAPILAADWMDAYFRLSSESSYTSGQWRTRPPQRPIINCMADLAIPNVDVQKSARFGATKLLVGLHMFDAEHRGRNALHFQPTDGDAEDFVKTELDTAIRDCDKVRSVFPWGERDKHNTINTKVFTNGCMLHVLGGKAVANYRRRSKDTVTVDELSAFDRDVEGAGAPDKLAPNRLVGAMFPKFVCSSTPRAKGLCLIEKRKALAHLTFRWHAPCPECGEHHRLAWGSMDWPGRAEERCGTTADERDAIAAQVRQRCPHCGALYTQVQYLDVWERGRMVADEDGTWIDAQNIFRAPDGTEREKPAHIRFEIWTGISDHVSWQRVVGEYLAAKQKADAGDDADYKVFFNETLGETYEEDFEGVEPDALQKRAEDFPLRTVPAGGLLVVCGVDVQSWGFEIITGAIGRKEEAWIIDYTVLAANPEIEDEWDAKLLPYLQSRFPHACGQPLGVEACSIDSGAFTHVCYNFVRRHARYRLYAVKGSQDLAMPIKGPRKLVDVNHRGKVIPQGVALWHVGTKVSKDALYNRLKLFVPGPGYIHLTRGTRDNPMPQTFFDQLGSEKRVPAKVNGRIVYRYEPIVSSARKEVPDAIRYMVHAANMLDVHRWTDTMWDKLEAAVQPRVRDMFGAPAQPEVSTQPVAPPGAEVSPPPASAPVSTQEKPAASGFFNARRRPLPSRRGGFVSQGLYK